MRTTSSVTRSLRSTTHQTVNMVVFFIKVMKNTCLKGRALMQMYRGGEKREFATGYTVLKSRK